MVLVLISQLRMVIKQLLKIPISVTFQFLAAVCIIYLLYQSSDSFEYYPKT